MSQQNKTTVVLGDGSRLFYSYKQLVGFSSPKIAHTFGGHIFTEEKFSVTTSRHIRTFVSEYGGTTICEQAFHLLRLEAGL